MASGRDGGWSAPSRSSRCSALVAGPLSTPATTAPAPERRRRGHRRRPDRCHRAGRRRPAPEPAVAGRGRRPQRHPASAICPTQAAQQAIVQTIDAQQQQVLAAAADLGATELGAVSRSLNAVVVHADAATVADLAAIPGVTSVTRVPSYDITLAPRHPGGVGQPGPGRPLPRPRPRRRRGPRRHRRARRRHRLRHRLHPLSTSAARARPPPTPRATARHPAPACPRPASPATLAPTGACAALFGPGAPKVVGGYDFVGESWPNGAVAPDPNPIDFEGHGTHVADILAGRSADGTHLGLAPGRPALRLQGVLGRDRPAATAPPCSRPSTGPSIPTRTAT